MNDNIVCAFFKCDATHPAMSPTKWNLKIKVPYIACVTMLVLRGPKGPRSNRGRVSIPPLGKWKKWKELEPAVKPGNPQQLEHSGSMVLRYVWHAIWNLLQRVERMWQRNQLEGPRDNLENWFRVSFGGLRVSSSVKQLTLLYRKRFELVLRKCSRTLPYWQCLKAPLHQCPRMITLTSTLAHKAC